MYELAASMPGFLLYQDFAASDGEFLTLVEFDTAEHLAVWRMHPCTETGARKVLLVVQDSGLSVTA